MYTSTRQLRSSLLVLPKANFKFYRHRSFQVAYHKHSNVHVLPNDIRSIQYLEVWVLGAIVQL